MKPLDEFQRDALVEMINIGMGRAAATLSEMLGQAVHFNIPTIDYKDPGQLSAEVSCVDVVPFVGVQQSFNGAFDGQAFLLLPDECVLTLAKMLIPDSLLYGPAIKEETLLETGNIIFNCALSGLANCFDVAIGSDEPNLLSLESPKVQLDQGNGDFEAREQLFIKIIFAIADIGVVGKVCFAASHEKIDRLQNNLEELISVA